MSFITFKLLKPENIAKLIDPDFNMEKVFGEAEKIV